MRKSFLLGLGTFAAMMLGGAAQAADMPVKAPPPPPPPMYNWTGVYIGGHIGGAWADRNGHDRFDPLFPVVGGAFFEDSGFGRNDGRFIVGGQIGFNYQVNQWVWGVEGQISALTNNDNDSACGFFTRVDGSRDHLFNCNDRGGWVATIAARLGVTFGQTGNWLLYVKGGGAFTDSRFGVNLRDDCLVLGPVLCDRTRFAFANNDDTRSGWMFGAGLEYGAWGNWSWKLEYNFMDFGHRDIHIDNGLPLIVGCVVCRHDLDADLKISVVKFGLNYRFGAAPAAAPAVTTRY